ncbi:MAG: PilZ domain-containing protein [Sedimentisphaerales bacterium]
MESFEKRKFKRLQISLGLSCRKVGSTEEKLHNGCTVNVSPGGLYFETADNVFEPGNLLKVELTIPPTAGLLEFGGRISGFGRVLRTCLHSGRYGVALEFCRSPKLCT